MVTTYAPETIISDVEIRVSVEKLIKLLSELEI